MHAGLISVVVPAYNRAATIAMTIDSVLAQTHADFESPPWYLRLCHARCVP